MLRKVLFIAGFWSILCATLLVYAPGLQGGFLFDDTPNLSPMAALGGVKDWETFRAFAFNGFAGPLGRPVSLASFLLNDNYWPSHAESFKFTNVCFHLLAGVLLCWSTLNLLRFYGTSEKTACIGAVLNMGVWLLHPYMVSTTLYVVQRMAQLATLFMLAGLAGYLHGRLLLSKRPRAAYVWMSISLAFGTALAALSKENGILLPILVLVLEWCQPKPLALGDEVSANPDWKWNAVFLWLPSLAVVFALLREVNFSPDVWPTRPFNQIERLLTESRILWEYIFHLYIPRIEGRGLYQDGFEISTSLTQPIETLWSTIGLGILLIAAVLMRKRWPYVSLAVLFFFAAHLVESTVVGLELYFEHRNYVASAFLFLPLILGLLWIANEKSVLVAGAAFFGLLITLGTLTFQRVTLWSDTEKLQTYWAVATPDSPRAQSFLATRFLRSGNSKSGFELLESAMERMPHSSLLSMQWLLQKVARGEATTEDFERVARGLSEQRFDAQAVLGLRLIVERQIEQHAQIDYRVLTLGLLDQMKELPQYRRVPLFNRLQPYLSGLLLSSLGRYEEATAQFTTAINRYREIDANLSMVAHMGSVGRPAEALRLLEEARKVFSSQSNRSMTRPRSSYEMEIQRLQKVLEDDLASMEPQSLPGKSQ